MLTPKLPASKKLFLPIQNVTEQSVTGIALTAAKTLSNEPVLAQKSQVSGIREHELPSPAS